MGAESAPLGRVGGGGKQGESNRSNPSNMERGERGKGAEIECVERGRGRRKRRGDISLAVGGEEREEGETH